MKTLEEALTRYGNGDVDLMEKPDLVADGASGDFEIVIRNLDRFPALELDLGEVSLAGALAIAH